MTVRVEYKNNGLSQYSHVQNVTRRNCIVSNNAQEAKQQYDFD